MLSLGNNSIPDRIKRKKKKKGNRVFGGT